MWTRIARLFVIKTKFEAFLILYGLALGATERGVHFVQKYPGWLGWFMPSATTISIAPSPAKKR